VEAGRAEAVGVRKKTMRKETSRTRMIMKKREVRVVTGRTREWRP
jgi:hypothetical protein